MSLPPNYRASNISAVPKPQDSILKQQLDVPKADQLQISTPTPSRTEEKENVIGRLNEYERGVKKIFEITGISDANEFIQKFATHNETFKNLEHVKSKNERKILDLQEKKLQV